MKDDSDTAKVDRWHGLSQEELAQGYGNVEQNSPDDTNNMKQLNGGMIERDDEMSERSD